MLLFVGLGNPGSRYVGNRHNIGFMAVEEIARLHKAPPWRRRFQGATTEALVGNEKVLFLLPETFMNESGRAVQEAMQFYKIALKDVIVFHDELDLPPAKMRVKLGGGNAGHNGLRSITAQCGNEYRRVRLGIGHPRDLAVDGRAMDVADYVLRKPLLAEQKLIETSIQNSLDCLPLFLKGDPQAAMLNLHSKD